MKNISVFGYATFGTPNGYTRSCIYGNKNLEKVLKTFDLKTDAIQLISPNDRLYSIRKEFLKESVVISYSVYTYAKERNSDRSGSFIGTSISFTDEISPENQILSSLHHIHQNLKNNNVQSNNTLNVAHSSEFDLEGVFSKDFEKLNNNTEQIDVSDWQNTDNNLVIFASKFDSNSIQFLFKKSLEILSNYYTIYLTDSKEMADFVAKQKLFKIIKEENLEQEIQNIENEKTRKLDLAVLSIQKEKNNALTEGKKAVSAHEEKITLNEKNHAENFQKIEKSKIEANALQKFYNSYSDKLTELATKLQTEKKIEEANVLQKELKRIFETEKSKFQLAATLSPFSTQQNRANPSNTQNYSRPKYEDNSSNKETKIDYIKLVSVILNLLLIAALAYFIFKYQEVKNQNSNDLTSAAALENTVPVNEPTLLNPLPNDSLKVAEYKSLLTKSDTTKIRSLVDKIFLANPENIGKVYQYQKKEYQKLLFEKNRNSFKTSIDTTLNGNESALIIPSFKISK